MSNRYVVSTRPDVRTFTGFSTTRVSRHFLRGPVSLPHTSSRSTRTEKTGAEMTGLVCLKKTGVTQTPRPRTVRACFQAYGANAEILLSWQDRSVGLAALAHYAPTKSNGFVGWRPDRSSLQTEDTGRVTTGQGAVPHSIALGMEGMVFTGVCKTGTCLSTRVGLKQNPRAAWGF